MTATHLLDGHEPVVMVRPAPDLLTPQPGLPNPYPHIDRGLFTQWGVFLVQVHEPARDAYAGQLLVTGNRLTKIPEPEPAPEELEPEPGETIRKVTVQWEITETHTYTFHLGPGAQIPDEDELAEYECSGTWTGSERTITSEETQ